MTGNALPSRVAKMTPREKAEYLLYMPGLTREDIYKILTDDYEVAIRDAFGPLLKLPERPANAARPFDRIISRVDRPPLRLPPDEDSV